MNMTYLSGTWDFLKQKNIDYTRLLPQQWNELMVTFHRELFHRGFKYKIYGIEHTSILEIPTKGNKMGYSNYSKAVIKLMEEDISNKKWFIPQKDRTHVSLSPSAARDVSNPATLFWELSFDSSLIGKDLPGMVAHFKSLSPEVEESCAKKFGENMNATLNTCACCGQRDFFEVVIVPLDQLELLKLHYETR